MEEAIEKLKSLSVAKHQIHPAAFGIIEDVITLLEQRQETASAVDTIVSGTMIASAGNAVRALSSVISGIANKKRKDLLEIELQNAKDQIEVLSENMQKYH